MTSLLVVEGGNGQNEETVIRNLLVENLDFLEGGREAASDPGDWRNGEPADQASEALDRLNGAVTMEHRGKRVGECERAIKRISEGNFDLCEKCGEKIPAERREALPTTTTCVRCAGGQKGR